MKSPDRHHLKSALALSHRLKNIPPRFEVIFSIVILLAMPYAVFAFKLFPNGDCYNGYAHGYYYAISSLLNGTIPLWDPMAACGTPFYPVFMIGGMLEPLFAVSVFLGKVFSLNVFQVYMAWIILRNFPIFIGMFWLLKQHCRHSTIALLGAAFLYYAMAICLLQDGVIFVVYWPLLLASLKYFLDSFHKPRPFFPAFYGSILLFCVSLLIYNPAYTLIFVGVIGICAFVVGFKQSVESFKLFFGRISIRHGLLGLVMIAAMLSPALISHANYQKSENFAYVRVHQAKGSGRTLSIFKKDPIDYMETNMEESPMRRGREFSSCLFPFFYRLRSIADGTVYFGFLGVIGVLFGMIFGRNRALWLYLCSAAMSAFLMTWSSSGLIVFAEPALPFLKMFNQRQLLYPAFLIFASTAGCIGFCRLLNYRVLCRIMISRAIMRMFIAGLTALVLTILFVMMASIGYRDLEFLGDLPIKRLYLLFLLGFVSIFFLARKTAEKPRLFTFYLGFLFFVFILDATFYYGSLIAGRDQNKGVLAHSRMLRERLTLDYRPFRSPVLPAAYGGTHANSIVHQMNLRSALPAYWHCDVLFLSRRYYDLISSLPSDKLKLSLGVTSPLVKIYANSLLLSADDDAVSKLAGMNISDLDDTLTLERANTPSPKELDAVSRRISSGLRMPWKYFSLGGRGTEKIEESVHTQLFDGVVTVPQHSFQEAMPGIYHNLLFYIGFAPHLKLEFKDSEDMVSRYFFPEFPFATDVDGQMFYASRDRQTLMKFVSGKGLFLESDNSKPTLPRKIYMLNKRPSPPDDAKVIRYGPNTVEILAKTESPAVLYYGDAYDNSWKAALDGKPTEVFIANHAFKAVLLPAGEHRVVFKYEVPYLMLSLAAYFLCILSFCAIAGYLFFGRKFLVRSAL